MSDTINTLRYDIIQDARRLQGITGNILTRDYYRKHSKFGPQEWTKYFSTFSEFLEAVNPAEVPNTTEETKIEYTQDKCIISLPKTNIHTLDELLAYCEVDKSLWEVDRFICNKWDMGYKDATGTAQVQPLWQVKAFLHKKQYVEDIRKEIEDLKNEAKEAAKWPIIWNDCAITTPSGNMLELLIPDLHIGKFAWSKETGWKDYDTEIAEETYIRAVESLIASTKNYKFDVIVLGVGNDLLQTDNFRSETYKGTIVSSDTRYQKVYKTARKMLCRTIERLREFAPVIVKVIPGNHDTQTAFTLGDSLECYFHNYGDVTVDNEPTPHKFIKWGDVLLLLTHGDKGKKDDYGIWMATEDPIAFGNSKFREIHIGHTHKTKLDEKYGIRVRTLSALCPPDAWHSENHFTGNLRVAEALVWNKTKGLIAQFYHTEVD